TGRVQVIHGNYNTYELMRAHQLEIRNPKSENRKKAETQTTNPQPAGKTTTKGKRKRKFPYRKVEELEADIAATETEIQELEQLLASPELYRDGERVKQTTKAFEEAKA